MKKVFVILLVAMFSFAMAGCSGGATFEDCVTAVADNAKKLGGGQLPDDAAKKAGELGCSLCKDDSKKCKQIIDALK